MNKEVVRIVKRTEEFPEEVATELRSKEKVELGENERRKRHLDRSVQGPVAQMILESSRG